MIENFRSFTVGPDPFDRTWTVTFQWLQTAISIRHSDTVDVKFQISSGATTEIKVIALQHTHLLQLSRERNRPLTDPWCMKLAALHLRHMILTDEDMDKTIITVSYPELSEYADELAKAEPVRR